MESPIIDVPVVIIGGGGVGLTLSCFLSDEKVQHVLFEKHPSTSILPKAHYLNQRTIETFRQHGIHDEIRDQAAPLQNMSRVEWRTSLGGDGPFDRRLLGHLSAAGGGESATAEAYRKDSPVTSSNLPLLRLEPILRRLAEERNPGRVFFNTKVEDFEEIDDRVIVTVQMPDKTTIKYRAQYVVACDGGKMSTSKLGINMEGMTGILDFVSTHFKADLSDYWDDRTLITHFINPEGGSMAHLDCGALLQMGPTWGRHSEEWVLTFGFPVTDDKRFDTDALPARIRQLLKLPDLEMEVQHVNHWVLDKVVADKYRVGRVFIAGDAAHRRPPASGLGLNTGIEDAQNIAWKLSSVIHGKADVSLLDTYEAERRPVGIRNSDWAFFSFSNLNVLTAGVGLIPGAQQYNQQRFRDIFEDSERGRAQLHHIRRVLSTQNVEYSAHDIELGFHYDNGVIVADGTSAPAADPEGQIYVPTTRPGHRLPHAWIEQDGKKISTQDLITNLNADFLLITDEDGDKWAEAAKTVSETTNVAVGAAQIRARDLSKPTGLCLDVQDMWIRLKEVAAGGAILVRPDNFVAWRSHNLSDEPEKELRSALKALMMQPLKEAAVHDEAALVVVEEATELEAKMADTLGETVALPAIEIDELEEDKNVKEGSEAGSLDTSTVASSSVATPNNEVDETHVEETPVDLPIVKEATDGKEGESLGTADVENMVNSIIHGLETKGFETVEAEPVDVDNKAVFGGRLDIIEGGVWS